MDSALEYLPELPEDPRLAKRPAYDPNNLHPMDEEDRKHDDTSQGIDWDEIIATTQDDWEAGRYEEFKSTDYPTDEALLAALRRSRESFRDREPE